MSIKKHQDLINNHINSVYLPSINNLKLREIVKYSLLGGKRLRSMIVLDISYNLSKTYFYDMALSIELLHTASLIIDDLPCMDNDDYRRGRETVHKKYGERAAKLVSYFLFYESFKLLNNYNLKDDDNLLDYKLFDEICYQNKLASFGQYFDLFNEKMMHKTIDLNKINLKTSPFFCIAFVGGFLLSGGKESNIRLIKKCALSFSNFFQICDDFEDVEQDSKNFNNLNQVLLFGKEKAKKFFYDNIDVFRDGMEKLNLYSDLMEEIVQYLIKKL